MPWSFVGNSSSGSSSKAGRNKTATKRKQSSSTSYHRRPRNFGRSLVNAAVRDMIAEEEEDDWLAKIQVPAPIAAAAAAAAASSSNTMPPAVVAAVAAAAAALPARIVGTYTPWDGSTSSLAAGMLASNTRTGSTRSTRSTGTTRSNSNSNTNMKQPALLKVPVAGASSPRQAEFLNVLFNNETSILPVTRDWRSANGVGAQDSPSDLHQHVNESILVFSFKEELTELATTTTTNSDNGSSIGKVLVLGATLYRRNNRKKTAPLEPNGQVVVRLCRTTGQVVHRWTNWSPANADVARMRPGIYVWLVQTYLSKLPSHPKQICVLQDETDLHTKDAACGLDWRHDYSHYVFAENETFPSSSGW